MEIELWYAQSILWRIRGRYEMIELSELYYYIKLRPHKKGQSRSNLKWKIPSSHHWHPGLVRKLDGLIQTSSTNTKEEIVLSHPSWPSSESVVKLQPTE